MSCWCWELVGSGVAVADMTAAAWAKSTSLVSHCSAIPLSFARAATPALDAGEARADPGAKASAAPQAALVVMVLVLVLVLVLLVTFTALLLGWVHGEPV